MDEMIETNLQNEIINEFQIIRSVNRAIISSLLSMRQFRCLRNDIGLFKCTEREKKHISSDGNKKFFRPHRRRRKHTRRINFPVSGNRKNPGGKV